MHNALIWSSLYCVSFFLDLPDNPWCDIRYKRHHRWFVETLPPEETRAEAVSNGLIMTGFQHRLMDVRVRADHNEELLRDASAGGRRTFKLFLEVLGKLGNNFLKVRAELQALVSSDTDSTAAMTSKHFLLQYIACIRFVYAFLACRCLHESCVE